MRITIFNNAKSGKEHQIRFFLEETKNFKDNSKETKVENLIKGSTYSQLSKQCSSSVGSPTRVLRRFLNKHDFNKGEGQYFAGSINGNGFVVFVDETWSTADVLFREGRSYKERRYEMVIADCNTRFGTAYNIYSNTEVEESEQDEKVYPTDVETLLAIIKAKDEQLAIKDKQIEKIQKINEENILVRKALVAISKMDNKERATETAKFYVKELDITEEPEQNVYFEKTVAKIEKTEHMYYELDNFDVEPEEKPEIVLPVTEEVSPVMPKDETPTLEPVQTIKTITEEELRLLRVHNPMLYSIKKNQINCGELVVI